MTTLISKQYQFPAVYHESHLVSLSERNFFVQQTQFAQSVLELGCGTGRLYPFLGTGKKMYVGLDREWQMLEYFLKDHPEACLVQAQWGDWPLMSYQFDMVVMARNTWFHVPPVSRLVLLNNVYEIMNESGIFVVEVDRIKDGSPYQQADFFPQPVLEIVGCFRDAGLKLGFTKNLSGTKTALGFHKACR